MASRRQKQGLVPTDEHVSAAETRRLAAAQLLRLRDGIARGRVFADSTEIIRRAREACISAEDATTDHAAN
jgi:hypothetical protein